MARPMLALLVLTFLLSLVPVSAEKVDLGPQGLRDTATHVVVGRVQAIYRRVTTEGNWETTHQVAEVAVTEVEKGEGLQPGGLVYARYWTRKWTGFSAPPPSTNGHRGVPAEGQSLRIYLARNAYDGFSTKNDDGGYNVIGANGFEALPAGAGK